MEKTIKINGNEYWREDADKMVSILKRNVYGYFALDHIAKDLLRVNQGSVERMEAHGGFTLMPTRFSFIKNGIYRLHPDFQLPEEEKRWFFDINCYTIYDVQLDFIDMDSIVNSEYLIEVQESELSYLKKPEGEFTEYCEFRKVEADDRCLVCRRDDNHYVHGGEATVTKDSIVVLILSGYRWCKPRKAEGCWVDGKAIIDGKETKARFWVEG